jgi:hypothetical protein
MYDPVGLVFGGPQERQPAHRRFAPENRRSPQKPPKEAGQRKKLRATDYGNTGLVFATSKSTPLDAQNIINRLSSPCSSERSCPT